ncbi:cuticle protein 6.4-like [Schistocerca americana]|uniref:cuticle protein 6.4-like n=1 Tax=Schistocerca americana TaxID=7009 RepID=UPI001F502764|nr:cuticle protein 6.4-like [Schistocerca americana]XP_049943738.1 cuticle protein 6.4-like [Schistocerca serialis cubense]
MMKFLVLALCLFAAVFAAEESAPKEKRGLAYATGLGYSAPVAYSGLYNGYSAYGVPAYASGYYGYSGLGYNGLGYAAAPALGYGYHGIY